MYFAKIPTLFDFNTDTIRVLPVTLLTDLNKLMVEYRQIVRDSKVNPIKYEQFDEISASLRGFIESL